jgi:AraC-like DNA-binding protein
VLNAYLPEQLTSIEFAAEIAGTSVRTLQRRLKNSDATYSDLITELRYERAARLLRESNATVLEIALEVGYEDPSHFSRAFKRIAGVSPREYRHQQSLN